MGILLNSGHSKNPLFSKLRVVDTMRKQNVCLPPSESIDNGIRTLNKYKTDALLVVEDNLPVGVITKTELMGAYYAGMEKSTELFMIMGSPVLSCNPEDSLESALVSMQQARIHRLYVTDQDGHPIGTLSYPDIVGSLYRYCCNCEFGLHKKSKSDQKKRLRYTANDVMTPRVEKAFESDSISNIIEKLSAYHLGALLIVNSDTQPSGVISKSDLALAFCRNVPTHLDAREIMQSPVKSCSRNLPLEDCIRTMIFNEVSRLFIFEKDERNIIGVMSLSDAARIRSGSCQACTSSRITIKKD